MREAVRTAAPDAIPSPEMESRPMNPSISGERPAASFEWKEAREPGIPASDLYASHVRPALAEKLRSVNLDKTYTKAEGDYLYYTDADGSEKAVLDLVGGYGGTFFGHNHPDLLAEAVISFTRKRPFLAQGSIRPIAALLAQRLSDRVKRATGLDYVATFANSGTEVNEAALKHALLERNTFLDGIRTGLAERVFAIRRDFRMGGNPEVNSLEALSLQLGRPGLKDFQAFFQAVLDHAESVLARPPVFLALEKGFHGKTTGALQLTANPDFSRPFQGASGFAAVFLGHDVAAWEKALADNRRTWLDLEIDFTGRLSLVRKEYTDIAAVLVEPIQGEGGIRALPEAVVRFLMDLPDRRFPIIVDEIQSGMGRTGRFLASEHLGLKGDYICLGKSLGGGLAKVGALLIDRGRFIPEFSLLHTSTFAEDDFSSAISLKAMDLMDAASGPMEMAAKKGAYLIASLNRLKEKYPDVLADVRGMGLMVGVDLAPQKESRSWLIRAVDNQKLLGYLVAGLLLNEHGIRIFPTLSSPNTLRLEPSCFVRLDALDHFIASLDAVCRILRGSDMYKLSKFMLRLGDAAKAEAAPDIRIFKDQADQRPKVAFLGHFINALDIKHRDSRLAPIPDALMPDYFNRTYRLFGKGECLEEVNVRSKTGQEVNLTFVGHYLTSEVIVEAMRNNDTAWIRERITASVEEARDRGCRMAGFGGYTSIVTRNCHLVPVDGIGLTTGNSLTVGMAVEAIFKVAREKFVDLQMAHLGVVGATGNIGSIYSQILADDVGHLIVFGTPAGKRRLLKLVARILDQAARQLRALPASRCKGVARSIATSPALLCRVLAAEGEEGLKDILDDLYANYGLARFIAVSTDLSDLRQCDLIVSASNDSGAVIHPHHLGDDDIVICDLAVPRDTSPLIEIEKPNVTIIQGGIVRLPENPDFSIGGIPLAPGRSFACMAETLLLGLEGQAENFSYGEITKDQVRFILGAAAKHGFALSEQKVIASL
jgi:acetylornithine/succinyldiaminopimelate/putrescine aminotransferase/predicted amino acid dehydrogenase